MLSPLGAWLNLHGVWEGSGYHVNEWQHQAIMGLDQYVKVVIDGFLFPFGHRASLLEVSERVVGQNDKQENIAYLRVRKFVIVREPEKDFSPLFKKMLFEGRQFPFNNVKISTLVTPEQKDTLSNDNPWITFGNDDFQFHIMMKDVEKQKCELNIPLAFVSQDFIFLLNQTQGGGSGVVNFGKSNPDFITMTRKGSF